MRTNAVSSAFLLAAIAPVAADVPSRPPVFSEPTHISNPLAPFVPGQVKVYAGRTDDADLVVVETCLEQSRVFSFAGQAVECAVRQEVEFRAGALVSSSVHYLAQADDGSVYAFGEVVVGTDDSGGRSYEGSWLVGGATAPFDPAVTASAPAPIVVMPDAPSVGDTWQPDEGFPLDADTVTVAAARVDVSVAAGTFEGSLVVREESDPPEQENERKWYAPEVGVVKTLSADESVELVAILR